MEAVKAKRPKEIVSDLSSKFYTHIPHDFGMKSLTNYVLDTESKVRAKLELLQSLQDI
jgi:poly [ADP-ribose] polymerase